MSVGKQLAEQLRHFDDEAFVALANRGLLRRAQKDLEKLAPTVTTDTAEQLQIALGEQQITFGAQGMTAARCSCPAAGICQHILAAALWWQQSNPLQSSTTSVETASPDRTALHDQLMAIPWSQLVSYAGKAGSRWALQHVADLDMEREVTLGGETYIIIRFAHPRIEFRYMGGPPEALIADIDSNHLAKYRAAAILAYQRAHGIEHEKLASDAPTPLALDLGKSHTGLASAATNMRHSRQRLLETTQHLLREMLALGLSHLSTAIHERATTLAVWAQGAEYYRLALALRRIAHQIEQQLERTAAADEHRLFDDLTITYALSCALNATLNQQRQPEYLTGKARSRYESGGSLTLLGLGANAWRTASGYCGMTMLFWSVTDQRFYSCTDARPIQQRQFDPALRYRSPGPWTGLAAPAEATGRFLTLSQVQTNQLGRISASATIHAILQRPKNFEEFAASLTPIREWQTLRHLKQDTTASLLAEPDPLKDWVVLQPTRYGEGRFDSASQRFGIPLLDATGATLALELPYSELNRHPIERLEQLLQKGIPADTLIVAKLFLRSQQITAEPLSLIYPNSPQAGTLVDALYFDPLLPGNFESRVQPHSIVDKFLADQKTFEPTNAVLNEVRHQLQKEAERGTADPVAVKLREQFGGFLNKLSMMGLTAFDELSEFESAIDFLLKMNLLILQYLRFTDN